MDTKQICKECGAPLAADAPQGLCPNCLMKVAMGSEAGIPGGSSERKPAPPPEEVARCFPQFEILALLGQGGMGAVYKARQPSLDRFVALKILPAQAAADAGFAERFNREARALAKLNHPNIVAVYDFGQADGLHYLIMEFVDGLNLRQLQQAGKLPPPEALQIIPQICEALQFAHDEGVVHRDIKPENVLLDKKGRVKIADFGLARILGREPESYRLTGVKDFMGTPHYMAPEQIEHPQAVDHRADIYSLGVVFYEMLTGELPLGKFQPPSKKVQVDVRLDEVVLHALERDVALRYQKASELKSDVETITNSGKLSPKNSPVVGPPATHDREAAFKSVQNPAIGLFITGILCWVIIPFTFAILWRLMKDAGPGQAANTFLSNGVLPMIVGTLMILAGQKMKRLEAYGLAIAACVLPMVVLLFKMMGMLLTRSIVIGPADLIGAPMGLWALVVLSRPEVKAAFARAALPNSLAVPTGRGRFFTTATVILMALGLAAIMAITSVVAYLSLSRSKPQEIETVEVPLSPGTSELTELSAAKEALSQLRQMYTESHPTVQALLRTIAELEQQADRTANTAPPVVVSTFPESGAVDVDPSLRELHVTFSKTMRDGNWSWAKMDEETFPTMTAEPRFLPDKRTCVLSVKLQPGKLYATWLNSESNKHFQDTQGQAALPYLLIFQTRK